MDKRKLAVVFLAATCLGACASVKGPPPCDGNTLRPINPDRVTPAEVDSAIEELAPGMETKKMYRNKGSDGK